MTVFISWSGDRSHKVADLLVKWLSEVTDGISFWLSSRDIGAGAQWFTEITQTLEGTTEGIFCLTPENKDKPWILFEAGALAKGSAKSRVRTLLIGMGYEQIEDPLAQFNHTFPEDKDSMLKMLKSLNSALGSSAVKENFLLAQFEAKWPEFEAEYKVIVNAKTEAAIELPPKKTDYDLLSDVLETVRGIDKRINKIEVGKVHPDRNLEAEDLMRILQQHDAVTMAMAFMKAHLGPELRSVYKHRQGLMAPAVKASFPGITNTAVESAIEIAYALLEFSIELPRPRTV